MGISLNGDNFDRAAGVLKFKPRRVSRFRSAGHPIQRQEEPQVAGISVADHMTGRENELNSSPRH